MVRSREAFNPGFGTFWKSVAARRGRKVGCSREERTRRPALDVFDAGVGTGLRVKGDATSLPRPMVAAGDG